SACSWPGGGRRSPRRPPGCSCPAPPGCATRWPAGPSSCATAARSGCPTTSASPSPTPPGSSGWTGPSPRSAVPGAAEPAHGRAGARARAAVGSSPRPRDMMVGAGAPAGADRRRPNRIRHAPMSWTHPTLHLPADLPADAVAFSGNAVLGATAADDAAAAPDPDGGLLLPAAGVRRLADALRRAGVPAQLLLPRAQSNGHGHRHADGGAALADRLAAAGLGPDVLRPVPPDAEATEAVRGRTLVVTRCRETASGLSAAGHPVVVVDRRPPHHDVLAWLAARVGPFAAAATLVAPPDERAGAAARAHHLRLTKPPGSLGRLEDLGAQLAAIAGVSPPPVPRPVATA